MDFNNVKPTAFKPSKTTGKKVKPDPFLAPFGPSNKEECSTSTESNKRRLSVIPQNKYSPIKGFAGGIIVGWFIVLSAVTLGWLTWKAGEWHISLYSFPFCLFIACWWAGMVFGTFRFADIALNTTPIRIIEFLQGESAEFICDIADVSASGVLLIELKYAKETLFSFEVYGTDRFEVKKIVQRKSGYSPMGGKTRNYFTYFFNNLPKWATGLRVRIKLVGSIPPNAHWIVGRIEVRTRK